ncbi:MAG: cytochrome c-type biogenesis CcmF C-terminal domain-containing protein, partial [Vibrio gallaecicus]
SPLAEKLREKQLSAKVMLPLLAMSTIVGSLLYLSQLQLNQLSQLSDLHWVVQITWIAAAWVFFSHIYALVTAYKETYFIRVVSMSLAHIGMAMFAIGAAMNSHHSLELNKKLEPGSEIQFFDWTLKYNKTELYVGSNFTAEKAHLELSKDEESFIITPERRFYQVRVMNMSEPAMKWFWHGDVYITMGEKIDSSAYAFRIQYKSYARWIWVGVLLSVLGGIIALFSRNQVTIVSFVSRFKYA